MSIPLKRAATAGVFTLASAASSFAGQPPAPSFVSGTELVMMNVVVQDERGSPLDGLPREAFTVFENGVARAISLFAHHDEPVTIGLVIDASGSMLANRTRLAYAVGQFAHTGRPDDEVFAIVVGDDVKPVLPADQPFTSDPQVLMDAVLQKLGASGRTAIWDGVRAGLTYLEQGTHARRALVVISDGQDNASRTVYADVLAQVRESSAAVYTLGLIDPLQMDRRPRTLRQLAKTSGGDVFFPSSHQAAFDALETVATQIRSTYTLGFSPAPESRDGRYHQLRVTVRSSNGKRIDGRTRAGYVAGGTAGTR